MPHQLFLLTFKILYDEKNIISFNDNLFSFGAFSSNAVTNENNLTQEGILNYPQTSELIFKKDKCVVKTTVTVTIDHGTYTETITVTYTHPC